MSMLIILVFGVITFVSLKFNSSPGFVSNEHRKLVVLAGPVALLLLTFIGFSQFNLLDWKDWSMIVIGGAFWVINLLLVRR